MRKNLVALVSAAALALAVPAFAQTNPLVGRWSIEYERGRRIENGEATSIMGRATLTIVQQGDSLLATLAPEPRPDGTMSPTSTMGGRTSSEGTRFTQKQTIRINNNGEMVSHEATLTWVLSVSGNALSGTMLREFPGMPETPEPTPVKGIRASS